MKRPIKAKHNTNFAPVKVLRGEEQHDRKQHLKSKTYQLGEPTDISSQDHDLAHPQTGRVQVQSLHSLLTQGVGQTEGHQGPGRITCAAS